METLYYNGIIRTMASHVPEEALLVRDGRIAAVGEVGPLLDQCLYTRKVDLRGRCLMPAFLDAHSHLISWAMGKLQADLGGAEDFAAIADAMGAFARTHGIRPGQWVLGRGADLLLDEKLAEELDRVLPENPALVQHVSSHGGCFNTAAQRLLGLSRGALVENEYLAAQAKLPQPDFAQLKDAFIAAQEDYLSHGYVLAQEGAMLPQAAEMYRALERAGAIRMSIVGYGTPFAPVTDGPIPTVGVACRGNKIFLDGSPQQRTAFLREPYIGGGVGEATMTEAEVLAAVQTAKEQGRQILAHCNGDAAIDRFLWALEEADYPPALRPVVIHAQLLRHEHVLKAKRRGAVLSFFVSHTRHWGDEHLKNLGEERAMTISPCRTALEKGVPFTLHQDTPVLPPTPLEAVACAALRTTESGVQLAKGERISVYEGLRAMTCGAAYQYHAENERGTLEAGKRADLVILSEDPLAVPAEELEEIRVLETISAGETLWRAEEA